ncbi:MAG: amidohydrolase family protein [Chloroflexota bacterium]|nr:amidohydrolase family protein [Chloroflexota bacterium]
MAELLIEGARLPDGRGPLAVLLRDGRIAAIGPGSDEPEAHRTAEAERLVANGRLLAPAFVDPHLHLDKALLLDRLPAQVASVDEAITLTAALKRGFTRDDMRERAERVLRMALRHGTLYARVHAEVDPILALNSVEVALELRERYAGLLELQVVAFPQEGIQRAPGTIELLDEALRLGADALGGVPYRDPDPCAHVDAVFRLGLEHGVPLDFHADFSDDPTGLTTTYIAERTLAEGYAGRVVVGHATALGALSAEALAPIADALARADISVIVMPTTDLYLGGRRDEANVRRGLAPVARLLRAGVNVAYATNNVRNAFTPFGNADQLENGLLLLAAGHLASPAEVEQVFAMATANAARAIGLREYGLVPGDRAHLVLLDAASRWEALVSQAEASLVIASGRVAVENRCTTTFSDELQ